MDFKELSYKSKIEICKLFYCDTFKNVTGYTLFDNLNFCAIAPKGVFFSWNYVEFETVTGNTRIKRIEIENWFNINTKKIRKAKLLEIRKNLS